MPLLNGRTNIPTRCVWLQCLDSLLPCHRHVASVHRHWSNDSATYWAHLKLVHNSNYCLECALFITALFRSVILVYSHASLLKLFIIHTLVVGKQTQRCEVWLLNGRTYMKSSDFFVKKNSFHDHTACWLLWGRRMLLASFTNGASVEVNFCKVFIVPFQYGQSCRIMNLQSLEDY